jgi:hypothetical protein
LGKKKIKARQKKERLKQERGKKNEKTNGQINGRIGTNSFFPSLGQYGRGSR